MTPADTTAVTHEVHIEAEPETVFAFFTDPDKMIQWKGRRAELDLAVEIGPSEEIAAKGEQAEEAAKVERSGLQGFFDSIDIVADKSVRVYQHLVDKHHVVKTHGWLIGSSAQHEINPALQAGLNAAFVPHPATWSTENAELQSGTGKLLIVSSFRGLRDHF